MDVVLTFLAVVLVVAGVVVRVRIRRRTRSRGPGVTDDMIRRIEELGRIEVEEDEPLDWDRIREEEDRFWSETWDRPEPYWE